MGTKISRKNGFATIYLLLILGSLSVAVMVILEVSSSFSAQSIADDACYITGRSLLGEYNRTLFERYGIFAIRAYDDYLEDKALAYLEEDTKTDKCVVKMLPETIFIDSSSYPALDTDAFSMQISNLGASLFVKDQLDNESSNNHLNVQTHPTVTEKRLPSRLLGFSSRESILLSGGIFDLNKEVLAADEYILAMCSNKIDQRNDTYLVYETEYVLFGYKTDDDNLDSMERSLYAARLAANLAKASANSANAAAAAKLLITINKKTETEVKQLLNGGSIDGMDYKAYLRVFLGLLDKDEKMARMMDIIQLNLSYVCGSGFAFVDYAYGFDMSVKFYKKTVIPVYLGTDRRYHNVYKAFCYQ